MRSCIFMVLIGFAVAGCERGKRHAPGVIDEAATPVERPDAGTSKCVPSVRVPASLPLEPVGPAVGCAAASSPIDSRREDP